MQPNKEDILKHLRFMFAQPGDYKDGKIEIAYTPADSGAVNQAQWFDVDDIESAAEFAFSVNAQNGVNVYVGAALREPDTAPFGRSSINNYYASHFIWVDIDDAGAAQSAKEKYAKLPPSFVVVTGRNPDLRAQAWWRLQVPETSADALKNNLAFVCAALGGDRAVVDPIRVMRLGGTIAWPKKPGRVPELTNIIIPPQPTLMVMGERFPSYFPGVPALSPLTPSAAAGGVDHKPRNIINGNLQIEKLLEATRAQGQWHVNMRDAIAAMVGGRWPDAAIRLAVAPYLRDDSLKRDMISPLINSARLKFGKPDPEQDKEPDFDPETGEIKEKPKSGLYYISAKDINPSIEANDFVQGMLGEEQLSVIYGESNCGKTFFATDLAFHVAQGLEWRGRRVSQGGVMYAALEGARGLSNRVSAYRKHNLILDRAMPFAMMPCQLDFFSEKANIGEFIDLIGAAKADIGDPKLIVIDTLARALAGGDENSGQDMGRLVYYADAIRAHTKAHVCFIHHSGKNKALGARGHSSLRAAVDTEIEISRDEGADFSRIKSVKQREMDMAPDMFFKLKIVILGVNKFEEEITSCVVEPCEEQTPVNKIVKLTANERFVYDAIVRAIGDHGAVLSPIKGMTPVRCVDYFNLTEVLESMGEKDMIKADGTSTIKQTTSSVRKSLKDKGRISFDRNYVWLTEEEAND